MLSKIILYSLLLFAINGLFANEKPLIIASHKITIDTTHNDSIRLSKIIDLSWDYRNYSTDSALYYSDWAIRLAKSTNQIQLLAKELDIRSTIMIIMGKLDSAEYYQNSSLKIRQNMHDYRGLRSSYEEMGNIKKAKGHYELALKYYFKALNTIDSIKYRPVELELYEEYKFETLDKFIEKFRKRNFDMSKKAPESSSVKFVHIANEKRLIGEIYLIKKDYPNAEKYLLEALDLNYRLLDGDQIVMNENAVSKLYLALGKTSKAKNHALMSKDISNHNGNYLEASRSFEILSNIELTESKYSKALNYLDSSSYMQAKYSDKSDRLKVQRLRILVDSSRTAKFPELFNALTDLVSKISKENIGGNLNSEERLNLYSTLFDYYSTIGEKDSIILYQTNYYLLKDSLVGLETQNRLSELLEIHESNKKEKTIRTQAEQIINYSDLLLLSGAMIVVILLFAIYMIFNNRKMRKLNVEISELNSQLTESTRNKEQLFSYIAHDLRGPLMTSNSVINMLRNATLSEEKMKEYLVQLGQTIHKSEMFTENLIHWAKTKTGTIKSIKKQVDLEQIISESLNQFEYDIANKSLKIVKNISPLTIETDPILFQAVVNNIVQNAVRYGDKNSEINIVIKQENSNWDLSVANTGKPISKDTISKFNNAELIHNETGNGIGLTIIKNYVELLELSISLNSESQATTFTISN